MTPHRASNLRTVVAGLVGGTTFFVAGFVGFVLTGSGLLHNPAIQSHKMLEVWAEEPLPMFVRQPHVILLWYLVFSIFHAFLFRSIASAWPEGTMPRTWRLALVTWMLSYVFFELVGPLNLLAEPVGLVVLEMIFWAVAALSESAVLVSIIRQPRTIEPATSDVNCG